MPAPAFNPANFNPNQEINNQYYPLDPGTVRIEQSPDGSVVDTFTITEHTLIVDHVRCIVVNDVVRQNGVLVEIANDYFAQDKAGNVWYFGENVTNYTNGKPNNHDGTWLAGVNGAQPGIVMEAHPQVGDIYRQENAPGVAQDMAKILSVTATVGDLHNLLVTAETSSLEPGALENKYYAKGIGEILDIDRATGETLWLVSIRDT